MRASVLRFFFAAFCFFGAERSFLDMGGHFVQQRGNVLDGARGDGYSANHKIRVNKKGELR